MVVFLKNDVARGLEKTPPIVINIVAYAFEFISIGNIIVGSHFLPTHNILTSTSIF